MASGLGWAPVNIFAFYYYFAFLSRRFNFAFVFRLGYERRNAYY